MALESLEIAPALSEKIPPKILAAAERIRVSEYLQLRYQSNRGHLSKEEYQQISDAAAAIKYDVAKSDNRSYDPGDKIERSFDPRVLWARAQLTNVPLPLYLAARHKILEVRVAKSTRNLQELETIVGLEEKAEKASLRKLNLENDLFLTEKVAAAAQISLT